MDKDTPSNNDTRFLERDDAGLKLEEVDDSGRGRFTPIPYDVSRRGIVEVEFAERGQSGVQIDSFNPTERAEHPKEWSDELRTILSTYNLESWKATFPLLDPWSLDSVEKATVDYDEAGRHKFVTFYFSAKSDTRQIAERLRTLPEIIHATAVPDISPPAGPLSEPLVGATDQLTTICRANGCLQNQWYLFRSRVSPAWQRKNAAGEGLSGKGVTIADIDWGFVIHQDLDFDLTKHMFPDLPDNGIVGHGGWRDHGTAALGLAGGRVNDLGMAGIGFGASLWAIQAGTDSRRDYSLWADAIRFVRNQKTETRKIILLEVQTADCGNIEMILSIRTEIMAAIAQKIVVCVPAGNGNAGGDAGIDDHGDPIPLTGSILVGATQYESQLNIRASNAGSRITVYAPGDMNADLTCSISFGTYRNHFGGTSGAVAKVAGVAALMLEKNPALTHEQVRDILSHSQIPVFDGASPPKVGVLLDADQAVCEAAQLAGEPC